MLDLRTKELIEKIQREHGATIFDLARNVIPPEDLVEDEPISFEDWELLWDNDLYDQAAYYLGRALDKTTLLKSLADVSDVEAIIKGMVNKRGLSLDYGQPQALKTIIEIVKVHALQSDVKNPLGLEITPQYRPCVIIEQDQSVSMLKQQIALLGLNPEDFVIPNFRLKFNGREFNSDLDSLLKHDQPAYVALDSLSGIGIVNLNLPETGYALSLLQEKAQEYDTAIVLIHHENRSGTILGSSLIEAKLDYLIHHCLVKSNNNEAVVDMFMEKFRGVMLPAFRVTLDKTTRPWTITRSEIVTNAEKVQKAKELRDQGKTIREIAVLLECSASAAWRLSKK